MKQIELYRWRLWDPVRGRRVQTRHRMTREDALETDPTAECVEHTLERRLVPSEPAEHVQLVAIAGSPRRS